MCVKTGAEVANGSFRAAAGPAKDLPRGQKNQRSCVRRCGSRLRSRSAALVGLVSCILLRYDAADARLTS